MSINTDYVAFDVKNFTGSLSLSGYALDICPFTFIPKIYLDRYSDKRILWDFGDGTTSTSLCATHYFLFPGDYDVTLYLYDGDGQSVVSSYTSTINVYNFITDTLSLSSKSSYVQEAGSLGHSEGITISRYNSWQSYNALSGKDYTINLFASGGNDTFFDYAEYNKDKYGHLDLSYKFYKKTYNIKTQSYNYEPINSVTTTNSLLYARISGDEVIFCEPSDSGSTFAGTTGTSNVFFVADNYNINDLWFRDRKPVFVFASFDVSNFDDFTSYKNGYREVIRNNRFSYLNSIVSSLGFTITPQLSPVNLAFSLNGIDGLGDETTTFSIRSSQYADTKIPIVIRVKDINNYPVKYLPLLSAVDTVTDDLQIKIVALSGVDAPISPAGQPSLVSSSLSCGNIGGYWMGYIIFDNTFVTNNNLENIYLSAYCTFSDTYNYLKYPTPIGVFVDNINSKIYRANFTQQYTSNNTVALNLDNILEIDASTSPTTGLGGIQVIPDERSDIGSYFSFWVTDSHRNYINKYDTFGNLLSSINISLLQYPSGSTISLTNPQPYYIAADSNLDIWCTLNNSVSTVKLSGDTGRIAALAAPGLSNSTYTLPVEYLGYVTLSSFIGKNTIIPGAVDIDTSNNVWVTYLNPLSCYLYKYSTSGSTLSSIYLTAGYSPIDIAIGTDNNPWIIAHQYYTTNTDITAFNDIVIYHDDLAGSTTVVYETTGRATNITLDTNNNAYITVGNNTVVKILSSDFSAESIGIESTTTTTASAGHLKGIASTASKEVVILNNASDKISIIDTTSDLNVNNFAAVSADFRSIGDWTGFRWVSKFSPRTFTINQTLTGVSSTFNVYEVKDRYGIGKFGENFDATQLYKDLRYQEALFYHDNMFDGFIGTIVGNISSSPNTIGKRVYEKAHNFVSNNVDPDTCGVDALYSLCKMYNIDVSQFDRFKFATPANLKRVIDLLSIKQSKLWGSRNKFYRDFDIEGYEPGVNEFYGTNLGTEIDVRYTILTAGSASMPIVAQSKFSGDYIYLNTDILSSQYIEYITGTETYPMSSFNEGWGWPLVLPAAPTYEDLIQNYRFYNYRAAYEDTQKEGVINWDDVVTLLNESQSARSTWIASEGIVEEIIKFTLMSGLSIFNTVDTE